MRHKSVCIRDQHPLFWACERLPWVDQRRSFADEVEQRLLAVGERLLRQLGRPVQPCEWHAHVTLGDRRPNLRVSHGAAAAHHAHKRLLRSVRHGARVIDPAGPSHRVICLKGRAGGYSVTDHSGSFDSRS